MEAYRRVRLERGDGREHIRALAQHVEVADHEVRIVGSKGDLLRTLTAASGANPVALAVPFRTGGRGVRLTVLTTTCFC
jgi:site-specific DNA recombinase